VKNVIHTQMLQNAGISDGGIKKHAYGGGSVTINFRPWELREKLRITDNASKKTQVVLQFRITDNASCTPALDQYQHALVNSASVYSVGRFLVQSNTGLI
jgi:hypothetical protein